MPQLYPNYAPINPKKGILDKLRWVGQSWGRVGMMERLTLKHPNCKGTSVHLFTAPLPIPITSCWYVFPLVSVHTQPILYHIGALAILDTSHQYFDISQLHQIHCKQYQYLATTIAHIGIVSHNPMAPSNSQQTSIFGRLGTRRLGTVISTISSVA
jgi:hypothetical protein